MGRTVNSGKNRPFIPYWKLIRAEKDQCHDDAGRLMGMVERVVSVCVSREPFFGLAILVNMAVFFGGRGERVMTGFLGHRQREGVCGRVSNRERKYASETSDHNISAKF